MQTKQKADTSTKLTIAGMIIVIVVLWVRL